MDDGNDSSNENNSNFDEIQNSRQIGANINNENNFHCQNKNQEQTDKDPMDKIHEGMEQLTISEPNSGEGESVIKKETLEERNEGEYFNHREDIGFSERINCLPFGLRNPQAYCFLNSVLQLLFDCSDFRANMINYFLNKPNVESYQITSFATNVGELLFAMEHNSELISKSLKNVQDSFGNSVDGDDIHNCFLEILKKINLEIKNPNHGESSQQPINEAEEWFFKHRNKNFGFIFENFAGQIVNIIQCQNCNKVNHKTYQLFQSLPLVIPSYKSTISLQECFRNSILSNSVVEAEIYSCCDKTKVMSMEITHAPKYLFLYLVRGAYRYWESKNNTLVTFSDKIVIPTTDTLVFYDLLSVIDHIGGSSYGHYYIKSCCDSKWWLKNDSYVHEIPWNEVQSENAIGFLFKKALNTSDLFQPKNLIYTTIYMFYLCSDFKSKLTTFNKICKDKNGFLKKLEEIFNHMKNNDKESIDKTLKEFLEYIDDHKMDIQSFYFGILNRMNSYTKNSTQSLDLSETNLPKSFNEEENNQFPFDDFMGKVRLQPRCQSCNHLFDESTQILKSLEHHSLPENCTTEISNEKYFKFHLPKSQDVEDKYHCCDNPVVVLPLEIEHAPKYLFLHLIKRTRIQRNKIPSRHINILTAGGIIPYIIRCIIFHIGTNETGHYAIKYFSDSKWYLNVNDNKAEILWEENPNSDVIGFFMEMKSSDYFIEKGLDMESNKPKFDQQSSFRSLVEILCSCCAFREKLIDSFFNFDWRVTHDVDGWYMKHLGEVTFRLKNNEIKEAERLIRVMELYFDIPTNIYNSFVEILRRSNFQKTKNISMPHGLEISHDQIDNLEYFNLEISEKCWCENCKTNFKEETKMFNLLRVPMPSAPLNVEECIANYLKESKSDPAGNCCDSSKIVSVRKIISFPQYLFIYFNVDTNYGNFISLENGASLETESGSIIYSLISTLHVSNGCYYTNNICMTSLYSESSTIMENDFPSINIIGIMMKCKDVWHQTTENDINNSSNYNCHPEHDNNSIEPTKEQESVGSICEPDNGSSYSNEDENGTNCYDGHLNKTPSLELNTHDIITGCFETINVGQGNENDMLKKSLDNISKNEYFNVITTLFNSTCFNNPLAPLVKLLYACESFRNSILDYHRKDKIAQLHINPDVLFLNDFCRIFHYMDLKQDNKEFLISEKLTFLIENYSKANFFQCYEWTLKNFRSVTGRSLELNNESNDSRPVTTESHSMSEDFVLDLFFGKVQTKTVCENCDNNSLKEITQMKLIPAIQFTEIEEHQEDIESYILNYINQHFKTDPVESIDDTIPRIVNKRFVQYPTYLFIFIDKISENSELKIRYANEENPLVINEDVKYLLCAEIGFPKNSDYRLRLFIDKFCYVSDKSEKFNPRSIGFMFQKQLHR